MFVSTYRCFPGFQVKYSCGVSLVFFGQNSINYNMLYGFRLVLVHVPILTRNGPKDLIGTGRCLTCVDMFTANRKVVNNNNNNNKRK